MKFCTYHIGARDGTREFPVLPCFEGDIHSVLFDGDADSIDGIQRANSTSASQEVHSFVFSAEDGPAAFIHTASPYGTSLLKRDSTHEEWNLFWGDHDCIMREVLAEVRQEAVQARSLDSLCAKELAKTPLPDFLSLDTQGSELAILKGAERALASSVVACVAEVEFHRLYENQPLFGDISAFLSDRGFWFVGFEQILDLAPYRYPVGLRGRGFHLTGNALFLKRPDVAAGRGVLCKLAFAAIICGCFEVAWNCFDRPGYSSERSGAESTVDRFLAEVHEAYLKHPAAFPLGFNERQRSAPPATDQPHPEETSMERIFNKWGLKTQADLLHQTRLKQQPFITTSNLESGVRGNWR